MTLGELIKRLESADPTQVVRWGFGDPHSYRGYYEQLAFEPKENVTVASMLADAKSALGRTFCGYKGGDYVMDEWTSVWIANYGESGGEGIGDILLNYMLSGAIPAEEEK